MGRRRAWIRDGIGYEGHIVDEYGEKIDPKTEEGMGIFAITVFTTLPDGSTVERTVWNDPEIPMLDVSDVLPE